ncbi:MAG: tRNA (adenosine(37)-N6)-threonylcarbamoyltransferase complex dimerization subunit type 1 TsaB [Erysipelotrichaceae bacterium]|nr:tRNA (adenosine(37)-N6)-threonylcarbamoyltransferase complex dimerization subunit type 1 TsaB [Erysipelotrichaceae bacterium]
MYSLLLDSSNTNLSVGICKNNQIIYQNSFSCWQRQSELMIPEIEKGLKEVSLSLLDFEEIVCAKGPGSYTGVRIALTIAKIISQMSGAKLILVSSLMAMGNANKKYIALMNARSARSYIGIYDQGKVILEDTIKTNEEVKELIKEYSSFEVVGEGSYLGIETTLPNEVEGLLSWKELINPEEDVLKVKPVYLKDNYGI